MAASPATSAGRRLAWHVAREAGQARVDAVEERRVALLLQPGNRALHQLVSRARRARQREQLRHPLCLVVAARAAADLRVRLAEQRVVARRVHRGQLRARGRGRLAREPEAARVVELLRPPRPQALADLLGELRRVAGRQERLARDDGRRLVVLPAALSVRPHGDDDVGPNRADQPDVIAEDLLPPPLLVGLVRAERVAEVDGAREVLLGAVELVHREQFLGPRRGERVEQLRPDLVLASVAARRAHDDRAHALAPAHRRQHPVVLIVGMRHGLHQHGGGLQLAQQQPEAHLAFHPGDGRHLRPHRRARPERRGQRRDQKRLDYVTWLTTSCATGAVSSE